MNPISARLVLILFAAAVAAVATAPAKAGYVSFDPPKSTYTVPIAINDKGAVIGNWFDGKYHGFVRALDGKITTFDPPDSVETTPLAINDKGVIVGTYKVIQNNFGYYHGFVRSAKGKIVTYDAPGSSGYTAVKAIDKRGAIAGYYNDDQQGHSHGFVRDTAGNFTSFDPPNSTETYAWAINDKDLVTGYYIYAGSGCGSAVFGGFVRTPDGKITTYDIEAGVNPKGINLHGITGGQYVDDACHVDGFVRSAKGKVTTFDYPGNSCCTYVWGINDDASVVGYYYDADNNTHGYLRTAKGVFTMIQPDDSMQTNSEAVGINSKGVIAGWYTDQAGLHGFIYTP